MAQRLSLRLADGNELVLLARDGIEEFGQLGELLGVATQPDSGGPVPVASVALAATAQPGNTISATPNGLLQIRLLDDDARWLEIVIEPRVQSNALMRMRVWHYLILCAGIGAALRGLPVVLMHGAVLLHGSSAILLCGDSGIGKSTTARRWEALGNSFAADDMFLLEFGPTDCFHAYALPTWSRCRVKPEGLRYPFDQAIPVAGTLGLSRDNRDDIIQTATRVDFLGYILRSMCFHTSKLVKRLPDAQQRLFSARMALNAGRLADAFPPCILGANLHGNLADALDGYLARCTSAR